MAKRAAQTPGIKENTINVENSAAITVIFGNKNVVDEIVNKKETSLYKVDLNSVVLIKVNSEKE
jgi:hypothetical protein